MKLIYLSSFGSRLSLSISIEINCFCILSSFICNSQLTNSQSKFYFMQMITNGQAVNLEEREDGKRDERQSKSDFHREICE